MEPMSLPCLWDALTGRSLGGVHLQLHLLSVHHLHTTHHSSAYTTCSPPAPPAQHTPPAHHTPQFSIHHLLTSSSTCSAYTTFTPYTTQFSIHSTTAPKHHSTTAPQHHSTTAPKHHSTTAPTDARIYILPGTHGYPPLVSDVDGPDVGEDLPGPVQH
jgi:hypothetical protein